jgi:hypothetical protein
MKWTYRIIAISPVILSLVSLTKKSIFGEPMPIETMEMGTPVLSKDIHEYDVIFYWTHLCIYQ